MRQKNGHGFTFRQERTIPHASTKLVKPASCHWSAWTKPGRCATGIDFVSFYVLLVGFWNYYNSVVFLSWFLPEHNNIDVIPRPTNPPEMSHTEHILNELNHRASRRKQKTTTLCDLRKTFLEIHVHRHVSETFSTICHRCQWLTHKLLKLC